MMTSEPSELLFFDTFSHETSEELNLDLVQFTKTVCVTEVRVIPLGARVQADFPGGVRLGATNPTQFQIEFFVNDLSKPGASTFESVGGLEYNQNGNIHVECEQRIPTDGLVLRGWYTTITLAVYGYLTKAIVHETPPPGPVPSQADVANPTAEWVQHHSQVGEIPPDGYMVEPVRDPYVTGPYPPDYPYQDDWSQPPEAYEPVGVAVVPKEGPCYEGDEWDQHQRTVTTPEKKPHWDRKERDRDIRHRGERDFREHSPDYDSRRRDYHYHHRGWSGRPRSPPPHRPGARTPPPPASTTPPPPHHVDTHSPEHSSNKKEGGSPPVAFESLSPGDVESISEGEIPEAEGAQGTPPSTPPPPGVAEDQPQTHSGQMDVEPFEPILSDEEIGDDADAQDMDYDFGEYAEDPLKAFNPYNYELQPFVFLSDPAQSSTVSVKAVDPSRLATLLNSVASERSTAAHKEEWVHAAEQLVTLLPSITPLDDDDVVEKIISWIEIGLDFEDALSQPQPGYKPRHIKAGVRLVEALCQCGEQVTDKLMKKFNVHQKLIELYHQEYMALSIKLMILRSLDASLIYKNAVESFLKSKDWNGYRKLVEMVPAKQLARVQFAITSLLQKLNLYEVLDKLNKSVGELVVEEGKENETNETAQLDLENIANSLEVIVKMYVNALTMISQPKRFLPVSAQFEIGPSSSYPDPYPALYTYFRTHRLLESFLILLTHPGTSCYSSIAIPIQEMITCLQDSQDGLRFLYAVPETINPLVRVLLGGPVSDTDEDTPAPETHSQLGLHLIYRLQALSHVDHLMKCYNNKIADPDHVDVYDHLQSLYCLTFIAVGKLAVVHVLSRGDHISVLLKYFKGKTVDKDAKVKKSPGKSYVADLITMTVKFSDHVPFLQKYAKDLIDIILKDTNQELNDVMAWLKPVENPSAFVYDDISGLVDIVKKNVENATSLPGELITAVRVLKYLGIPPRDKELSVTANPDSFEFVELKYKCVMIQLYSLEGVSHLSAVLQKLCEHYEQPSLHSARLAGRQGLALTSFVSPALQLIRKVLAHVIKCRNTEFKDLTTIPVLLQTYSLMQAIPITAQAHFQAQKVCRDIVETLLAFTQPVSMEPGSEAEALNKSLWTLMMAEVLKYAVATPNNFLPGLSLISELLPLPLQVQIRSGLGEEEITRMVNSRKLWSAHLHCLSTLIHDIISTMCSSSYNPLLQLLRSVCVQLADLAAPTAITVTRAVLDTIVKALGPAERPATGHLMRLLTFLACLATHASVKAGLIQLIVRPQHATDKAGGQRYADLVVSLCHVLRAAHDSPTHVQAQECIVSVVQSLCHCELTLMTPPPATAADAYLANTLPPRDLLGTLVLVMLDHVGDGRHSLTTLQPCLRTFLMLTEHDYGFFHLKNCLEKKTEALYAMLTKVVSVWTTDRSECVAILSTLLELLRGCLTPDPPDEVLGLPARMITMSAPELAAMLGWQRHSPDNKHPLYTIDSLLLQENRAEDETLETMCENVTELVRLLEEEGSKPIEPKDVNEPLLLSPDSLLAQFTARPVVVGGEVDDDRLTASYWLTVPQPDDQDSEMQQMACDLVEVARADLPELPLVETVATLCRHKAAPGDLEHANPVGKKRPTNLLASDTNTRRPFIAPMRGRGFRGSGQRGDMFRSRPPNTSRPPSLHVDDFVALETCGQQPTGPTGYNKISMRVAQDMIATRVRGRPRPFGVDRGGRFFPTPYARRDNGNGRDWHGEGLSSSGSGSNSSNFRQPPPDMRGDNPHFVSGRPPLRGPPPPTHPWSTIKEGRERFGGGALHRHNTEQHRHMRFFSR